MCLKVENNFKGLQCIISYSEMFMKSYYLQHIKIVIEAYHDPSQKNISYLFLTSYLTCHVYILNNLKVNYQSRLSQIIINGYHNRHATIHLCKYKGCCLSF